MGNGDQPKGDGLISSLLPWWFCMSRLFMVSPNDVMVVDNSIASSLLLILAVSWGLVMFRGSSPSDNSDSSEDNELQVMLKKIAGMCLVIQLWPIQLYEADFNF